jgi:uncharacterized protein YegL
MGGSVSKKQQCMQEESHQQQPVQEQQQQSVLQPQFDLLQQQVQTQMPMQRQSLRQQPQRYQQMSLGSVQLQGDIDCSKFNDDDQFEVAAMPCVQQEPEPDTSVDGPLSLNTRIEYSALPTGQTQDVFGLVTVQAAPAPVPEGGVEAERQAMDIVAVLDVSGSMRGDKIRQVQDATRFIIDQAHPGDRLSSVTFNSSAARVMRLRRMNAEGKNEGNVSALRLSAGGGTSIAAGLDMALSVMEQRRQRNQVSAILLLTDGQDGATRNRIPELMQRASAINCAVYAFGFGRDHDAGLLCDIAEQAQTPFTFVEDTDKIREAFAGAVGGLSSIVAQKVDLTLKCHVPLQTVHTPFPLRQTEFEATISIPDMFALERRDILVELAVPAGSDHTVLLEASARYNDLRSNRIVDIAPVVMEAQRVDEPQPEAEPDEEVSAQRERVEVTRVLRDATEASDRGQFDQALQLIEECDGRMKKKKKTAVSEALEQEFVDARNRMRSRSSWEQGGRAELKDAAQMHMMQRCTNNITARACAEKKSKAMYLKSTQLSWIQSAKKSKGNSTDGW